MEKRNVHAARPDCVRSKLSKYKNAGDDADRGSSDEALRECEERHKVIFEGVGDGIIYANRRARVIEVNPAFTRITGIPREEIVGKSGFRLARRFAGPKDIPKLIQALRQVLKGEPIGLYEFEINNKIVEISTRVLKKESPRIIAVVRDISDRRHTEEVLKENEQLFRRIFENSLVGMYRTTPDGRIVMANAALVRMLGYSSFEELAARNLEQKGYDPDYPRSQFKRRIEADGRIIGLESTWRRRDGTMLFARESAQAIRDNAGNILYYEGTVSDITKSKLAEKKLRESEEKYRSVIENANIGILVIQEGKHVFYNSKIHEMLGYTAQEFEEMDYVSLIHPADRTFVSERIRQRLEGLAVESDIVEIRLRSKSGETKWIQVNSSVIRWKGWPALQAFLSDITERKRAEEELQERKNFLRDIFNGIQDGINVLDRDLNIIKVNQWIEKKYPEDMHLVGRKCYEVYQRRETICPWCPAVKTLSTGEVYVEHIKVPSKDGSFWWCEFSTYPLKDQNNQVIGVLGYKKNINERKRAENALVESEAQLKRAQEVAHIGSWYLDLVTTRLAWSDETYRIFGVPIGRPLMEADFLASVHPDDMDYVEAAWAAALQGVPYDIEHRIFVGETIKWVREKARLEFDVENRPISGIGTVQDITELKKAESELREYQEKLKAMTSKILESQECERRRLAIGLHDDICQRLVLSKLTLESSLRSISDVKLAGSLRMTAETLGETIRKAESLTFELSNPILREFGFVPALEEYLAAEIRGKHGITFELDADNRSLSLRDDVNACLYRITRELLNNVVKHARAQKVRVSVHKDQDQIHIVVQDDGVGFEPVKVREEDSRMIRFGLFSIREQLEHLGGRLLIESKPGQGTVATIVVGKTSSFMQERM